MEHLEKLRWDYLKRNLILDFDEIVHKIDVKGNNNSLLARSVEHTVYIHTSEQVRAYNLQYVIRMRYQLLPAKMLGLA
jgi:hypothetical protein